MDIVVFFLATLCAQICLEATLAVLLYRFYRGYGRPYLLYWAVSWGAFALFHIATIVAIVATSNFGPYHPLRAAVSVTAFSSGYLQILGFLGGTYALAANKTFSAKTIRLVFLIVLGIALATS